MKDAHANGYDFDTGMFRINKTGDEVVLTKKGPEGKPHTVTVLGPSSGQAEATEVGYEQVSYPRYFDAVAARGDAPLFIANFSCWSDGKSAFEWDAIRKSNVEYLPTHTTSTFFLNYWHGITDREVAFITIKALDKKMAYAELKQRWPDFTKEVLMPDDPKFVETITEKIKSQRAGNGGIPVRIELTASAPVPPQG